MFRWSRKGHRGAGFSLVLLAITLFAARDDYGNTPGAGKQQRPAGELRVPVSF